MINIGATIWVMDPAVQTVANTIPLPDYVLDEVRSIPGVKYAVPLIPAAALLKLRDGTYQAVNVIGLDDTSLFGRPQLLEGKIEDIYAENAFIVVKDSEFAKLENPRIGTEFELNDHRGVIVGIAKVASSGLFGVPTLYTTYNRALQYIPNTRFTISYVLVEPKTRRRRRRASSSRSQPLGYLALTKDEFIDEDLRLLQVPDRHRHEHAADDGDQLHRRPVDLRPDLLHVHPREPGEVRRAQGDRRQGPRARRHDPVPGDVHGARPATGWASACAPLIDLARQARLPDYAAIITFATSALAFVMVVVIAAISSYIGVRKVLQHRAVRHLPGLSDGRRRNPGERRSTNGSARARPAPSRSSDVSFEANFGEMLYIVGPSGSGKTTLLSMISGILRPNARHA